MKNLGGRPAYSESEKKKVLCISVRPCHVQTIKDYAKMLNSLPDGEMPDGKSEKEEEKMIGVVKRDGQSIKDKVVEVIKTPATNIPPTESEVDYTLWQGDPLMKELDRAICYVTDGFGYPEAAEPVYKKYPLLWARLHNAKGLNKMDEYNVLMTELWEKVK